MVQLLRQNLLNINPKQGLHVSFAVAVVWSRHGKGDQITPFQELLTIMSSTRL